MSIFISPPNSIVFLHDALSNTINVPIYVDNTVINKNSSCLSICTLCEIDGETEFVLVEKIHDLTREFLNIKWYKWTDFISLSGRMSITTSDSKKIADFELNDSKKIAIGINDEIEPNLILIVVDGSFLL
jgi:hypothetical protein